jgi:GNAT superfamily N-acetyltransferase
LERTTFCFQDSYLDPLDFGVADRLDLLALKEACFDALEPLDRYIGAHGLCRLVSVRVARRAAAHQNQRAYHATHPVLPDWRITCFFTAKGYRGRGIASVALGGALKQIEGPGGGRIKGYPEDTEGPNGHGIIPGQWGAVYLRAPRVRAIKANRKTQVGGGPHHRLILYR